MDGLCNALKGWVMQLSEVMGDGIERKDGCLDW